MNPFDLRGPEFLLFYSVLGVAVVAFAWFCRRSGMSIEVAAKELADPYEIACLRGGPDEAIRVATCALIDRGLLRVEGLRVSAERPDAAYLVAKPIEKALMKECSKARDVDEVMKAVPVAAAASELEEKLVRRGLLASKRGLVIAFGGSLLMAGVAGTKIVIALGRGRTNVTYLLLLAILFSIVLLWMARNRRTFRGLRALHDLRTLLRGSRSVAYTASRHSPDLDLLTAVFGLAAAWSHSRASEFRKLFPKSANEKGNVTSYGTTCGSVSSSGCGSSCSSGGSSCGGGGCGGGCGGCGG